MAELLTSRQNRSKKGKFAKRKLKSLDDMSDENNNDIVEDLEQHIQWNEGRRIVELGKLAYKLKISILLSQKEGMQVLAFKNITQRMKSFSILMVKSCGPYKYTYYIHVSVAISGFLEWCANKNGDQIVSLKRKVTLVLSANCPIYRIARICLSNGLYDL